MGTIPCPSVIHFDFVRNSVEYLLSKHGLRPITLVACSMRDAFIQEICAEVFPSRGSEDVNVSERIIEKNDGPANRPIQQQHHAPIHNSTPLLSNTIGLIASSQRVNVVFSPTLAHLRAFLGTFSNPSGTRTGIDQSLEHPVPHNGKRLLAIINLISIHSATSEFSAQGISRTAALAVEIAAREDAELLLCECNSAVEQGEIEHGQIIWDIAVPLLSSSVYMGEEQNRPSKVKTVKIRQIIQKWFRFDHQTE
ncbi:hypothetical protein FQN57_003197 [Myotisia sp. PD_48]|nr:hypothetical protein FQN57_003197 [Myotisia sp. PD_48]